MDSTSILKPGDRVNLIRVEFCIYGPAINATSFPEIAQHFVNVYSLVVLPYDLEVGDVKVSSNASTLGTSGHVPPAKSAIGQPTVAHGVH